MSCGHARIRREVSQFFAERQTARVGTGYPAGGRRALNTGRNQREFFRVFGYIPTAYEKLDAEINPDELEAHLLAETDIGHWQQLKVKRIDISGNGIFFETTERYCLGDLFEVHLFVEQVISDIVVVYGRVVRVEEHPHHTGIALQFIGMTEKVLSVITAYVLYRERELIAEKRVGWL